MSTDWQANALNSLTSQRRDSDTRRTRAVLLRFWPEGHKMMIAASVAAGVNQSTYMRRSIAVQIAKHLDIPLTEVLMGMPPDGRKYYTLWQQVELPYDAGRDIENYCPCPTCNGEHWNHIYEKRVMPDKPVEIDTTLDTTADPIVVNAPVPTPDPQPRPEDE